jgi:hypothetical protein
MTFASRTFMDAAAAGGGGGGGGGSFTPVTNIYTGPGVWTVTIPTPAAGQPGPTSLTIELGGVGGGGSYSPNVTSSPSLYSGSGGSGSLCRSVFPLTSADYGKTFNVSVPGGADGGDPVVNFNGRPIASQGQSPASSTVTNGTFGTSVNMQAGGGWGGTWNPGAGGPGGTASGGNAANLSGNAGQGNSLNPTPSRGGVPVSGFYVSSGAGGDSSRASGVNGQPGLSSAAAFAYT